MVVSHLYSTFPYIMFILSSKQQWSGQTIYLSHFIDEEIEVNLCYIHCEVICEAYRDN